MTIDQIFKGFSGRLVFLLLLMGFLLILLVFRLWYEQLRLGPVHKEAISKQSIRRIRIPPIRGRMFSSDGKLFTDNVPTYNGYFHIHELRQPGRYGMSKTVSFLYDLLDHTAVIIGRKHTIQKNQLKRHSLVYPALPFKAFPHLTNEELAKIFEMIPGVPGLEISTRMTRVYPMGEIGAHTIGFVGRKDPKLEKDRTSYSYFLPELTGRTGLEKVFEGYLKGKGGAKLVRVDSVGFFHDDIGQIETAQMGNDLLLSLDSKAQRIAQDLLKNKKGAMVLLDCTVGAVLAFASAPSYNLEDLSAKNYTKLANDNENLPLLNRCVAGGYSPGSILKPLIAMAMLEEGTYEQGETYNCIGYFEIGDTKIRCSAQSGHGPVTLVEALETSCNSFFIKGGIELGIDRIRPYLKSAGIGQETGLELKRIGGQGVLPGREYKLTKRNHHWNAFDTGLISIGQGMVTLSPLHAAMYTAALANGGTVYRPFLVKAVKNQGGFYVEVTKPKTLSKLKCSPTTLQIIKEGMKRVVVGPRATAPKAITTSIELAGKTGTAEIGSGRNKRKNTWFICYGPVDEPEYAMAVLVENGDSGGLSAAPLAKQFFERYFAEINQARFTSENSKTVSR